MDAATSPEAIVNDHGGELVIGWLGVLGLMLTFSWYMVLQITAVWDQKTRRRELTLATTDAFYKSYGEFFAVWKEWSALGDSNVDGATRSQLLRRAATAEGAVESLLLKLTVERRLSVTDVEIAGCFRQAYQVIRESIRDDRPVGSADGPWYFSDAPGYAVFKGLAARLAQIVSRETEFPKNAVAQQAFLTITSNRFESTWVQIGQQLLNAAVRD